MEDRIDERKRRILDAIIDDYIETAIPVGSRTITKKYDMGISSATIRNEMSDLEELGYLAQPHVSAGRVPSCKAYRLYVDDLLKKGVSESENAGELRAYFTGRVHQLEDVVRDAAQALSEMTRYTALVMMPKQVELKVTCLQLVPVSRATALLVIVTDGGIVRDTVIHVNEMLDADALYAISRMLTERFSGRTLRDVQEMLSRFAKFGGADNRVMSGVAELLAQMEKQASGDTVLVGGSHNILNYPEYTDVEKARCFLSMLETKEKLIGLLQQEGETNFGVRIGSETGLPEMQDCSLVTARYAIGKKTEGAIGIIGPTRMPYRKVLSILSIVAGTMSDMLQTDE